MRFALQLYSLRDDTQKNADLTLRRVSEMGYENVEFAGYYGKSGKEMKELLDSLNLKAISSHVIYPRFTDNFKEEVELNHAVGNDTIVLPWMKTDTLDEAKKAAEDIEKMAQAFIREGFKFGYHNHAHEFKPLDGNGTCAMDFIREVPGVKLQPDVFWLKTAGIDPVEFINKNSDRLISIHMKEYREDGFNVELGNGILPWREIMSAAQNAGVDTGIVEQEEYTCEPIKSVEICRNNIKKIFG